MWGVYVVQSEMLCILLKVTRVVVTSARTGVRNMPPAGKSLWWGRLLLHRLIELRIVIEATKKRPNDSDTVVDGPVRSPTTGAWNGYAYSQPQAIGRCSDGKCDTYLVRRSTKAPRERQRRSE